MFEWDEHNVDPIARHHVSPDEAEDVFADPRRLGVAAYNSAGEQRWALVGATEDGRVLLVVYTRRGGAIRVIHARDADPVFRRRYRRR